MLKKPHVANGVPLHQLLEYYVFPLHFYLLYAYIQGFDAQNAQTSTIQHIVQAVDQHFSSITAIKV